MDFLSSQSKRDKDNVGVILKKKIHLAFSLRQAYDVFFHPEFDHFGVLLLQKNKLRSVFVRLSSYWW